MGTRCVYVCVWKAVGEGHGGGSDCKFDGGQ